MYFYDLPALSVVPVVCCIIIGIGSVNTLPGSLDSISHIVQVNGLSLLDW
jgi:hypothetical protein